VAVRHRLLRPAGAIPLIARTLVARLAELGPVDHVTAFAFDVRPGDSTPSTTYVRVATVRAGAFDLAGLVFAVVLFFRLVAVHRRRRLHVLLCHDSTAFYGVWLFSKLYGVPHAVFMHACIYAPGKEGMYGRSRALVYKLNTRFYLRAARRVCCVSRELCGWAERLGAPRRRVVLMPNWVDLSRFAPSPSRPPQPPHRLLYVGRLSPEKGPVFAVRAMPAIVERMPQAELTVVGDGRQRAELERLAGELGVGGRVRFVGAVANTGLPDYYRRAGLLVMPSLSEGQGVVAMEALACGIPVVGSRVGGIPESVRDGVNGLLVPPGEPQALARAVADLLADRERYAGLAAAAPGSVASRSWRRGARRYLALCRLLRWRGHASR